MKNFIHLIGYITLLEIRRAKSWINTAPRASLEQTLIGRIQARGPCCESREPSACSVESRSTLGRDVRRKFILTADPT